MEFLSYVVVQAERHRSCVWLQTCPSAIAADEGYPADNLELVDERNH